MVSFGMDWIPLITALWMSGISSRAMAGILWMLPWTGVLPWHSQPAADNFNKGGRKVKHDATIKTVTEVGLAVDENLRILKHVIEPEHKTGQEKRICVVTGTHGDELEGQYVCYELNRILREQKEHLKGIVEIYPALNPWAWTPYPGVFLCLTWT